jgi:ATP-dependent Clp protease ATP-binding subunit ClpX
VLKEPKNALIRQYQSLFEMENSSLSFTDEALAAISRRAMDRGTGARGLRSIVEDVMLDIMFELPDQPEGSTFAVTEDVVEGRDKLFKLPEPKTKSA